MRRGVLTVLTLLVVLVTAGSVLPASAAGRAFTDVTARTPFAADIEWLAAEGIVQGGGAFRPTAPVTRRAMAVLLYRLAHPGEDAAPRCSTAPFRDVPKTSAYCGPIRWLARAGITSGTSSGGFAPLAPVTRRAMAVFLHKLQFDGAAAPACTVAPYADVPRTSPFCGSIDWLSTAGVTTTALGGRFGPTRTVSRGMMAAFLHRLHVVRTTPLGADVSHPQCGRPLPTGQAFGIVGVNAGKPRFFNPCLTAQLEWAAASTGATAQPTVQVYVNTANPGRASDAWPCEEVSAACARRYGEDRAREDLAALADAGLDPADHVWWLDVEEGNSWETSANGRIRNRAVLEGMVDTLEAAGAVDVGLYSTSVQWASIVGSVPPGSSLLGRPSWLAGALGPGAARRMCGLPPLTTGGTVAMVQFIEGGFDRNHVCP